MASPNRVGTIDSRLEPKLYRSFARKKKPTQSAWASFISKLICGYGTLSPIVWVLESVPAADVTVIV